MTFTRSGRYRVINDVMNGLVYRNRRDEPLIPGDSRMLAEELDLFEAWCSDLEERLILAVNGRTERLIEALIAFRTRAQPSQ